MEGMEETGSSLGGVVGVAGAGRDIVESGVVMRGCVEEEEWVRGNWGLFEGVGWCYGVCVCTWSGSR